MINKQNADPFATDQFGNSAFSVALMDCNPELVKWFIENQKPQLWDTISSFCIEDKNFCEYMAKEVSNKDLNIFKQLFNSKDQIAKICFSEILG